MLINVLVLLILNLIPHPQHEAELLQSQVFRLNGLQASTEVIHASVLIIYSLRITCKHTYLRNFLIHLVHLQLHGLASALSSLIFFIRVEPQGRLEP